jgi:carbamoyl-phosphate synthase small subunit
MVMKGRLILETGEFFIGVFISDKNPATGMLVFDTRVVGYEKVLTSPEYSGKIVCFTYPLIGNYGINYEDTETENIFPSGIVISENSEIHSNFRANCSLNDFLKGKKLSAIEGVDTQKITTLIRENNGIWAGIFNEDTDLSESLKQIKDSKNKPPHKNFYKKKDESSPPKNGKPYIALFDMGIKKSEMEFLKTSGYEFFILNPGSPGVKGIITSAAGIYVSSGSENMEAIVMTAEIIKTVLGTVPVFGTGAGHIVIGVSCGGKISGKVVNHYGVNQPVMDRKNKKYYITEQAHSLILETDSLTDAVRYININDGSVEGLDDRDRKVISTAFQPAEENFKEFFEMVKR